MYLFFFENVFPVLFLYLGIVIQFFEWGGAKRFPVLDNVQT